MGNESQNQLDNSDAGLSITNNQNFSENQFSETTNKLISDSYNELITDIYKRALLVLNINNKDIPIDITLYDKNDGLTQNYVELFKYYIGSTVFKFNKTQNILYMGDYLNNNGTANYTASRTMININDIDVKKSNFIPAFSISMVCTNHNNNTYIGSQFIINLSDINTNTSMFIPFGTCSINQSDINHIINYYNKPSNVKPYIKNMSDLSISNNIYQNDDLDGSNFNDFNDFNDFNEYANN